jgi:hypothetical protein
MESLLHWLQVKAFGRGFRGYHTAWFVVGAAAWMILRARNRDDVVYRTVLKPGERLTVTSVRRSSTPSDGR